MSTTGYAYALQKNLLLICAGAILCELYYHGYGNLEESQKMPQLERHEVEKLINKIDEYSKKKKMDFSNSKETQISEWCLDFFKELDNWKLSG